MLLFRPYSYLGLAMCVAFGRCEAGVEKDVVSAAIRSAATYLIKACAADGHFLYRIDLDSALPVEDAGYNAVRHAGAVYALAIYMSRNGDNDPAARAALQRAATWLRGIIKEVPGYPDLLAVGFHRDSGPESGATLGATALGLLALLAVEEVIPGTTPRDVLEGLGKFLLFLQHPDGSFADRYIPDAGKVGRGNSLYYPGEAILALLTMYEKDTRPSWLDSATKALCWLLPKRAEDGNNCEPDHWVLLAAAKWLRYSERAPPLISRERVIDCSATICRCILKRAPHYPTGSVLHGCLTSDGRTCPTATRLEGLLAAYYFLPPSEEALRSRVRETCRAATAFLIRSQVKTGPWAGAIPMAIRRPADTHPSTSAAFLRRAREVRIDYVQHTLCALLNSVELLEDEASRGRKP